MYGSGYSFPDDPVRCKVTDNRVGSQKTEVRSKNSKTSD